MKKVMSMLLAVVMILCIMTVTVSAAGAAISVSSATDTVGETVTINVSISGNPGFASGKVALSYDKSALELIALEGVLFKGSINAAGGIANHYQGVVTGDGVLVKATFKLLTAGTHPVQATLTGMRTADGAAIEVAGASGVSGTVTAEKPVCNHVWDEGKVTKEATCTETGVKTYTCTLNCGETKTETIPTIDHKFGQWKVTKEATCTETGVETRECVCGEKETREIPATGHKFGDWTVTKEATCTETGVETRECACGEKETREIPVIDHALNTYGKDEDQHWLLCDNCDYVGEKEDHDYDYNGVCECGATKPVEEDPDLDDVPTTGDITPYITMTFVSVLVLVLAVTAAVVLKRKNVK